MPSCAAPPLEAARTSAVQKSVNERWQRWHHMTNVIRFLGSTVLLAVGYVAGQMDLIHRARTWIKAFLQHSKEMFQSIPTLIHVR